MQELEVHFSFHPERSTQIGTIAEQNHRIFFEYTPEWISRGLELSPFNLPLRPGLQQHENREFGPIFGLFDDSLPDGWGLLLMDRYFRKMGLDPTAISILDRLAYLGECTMGALTYQPATSYDSTTAPFNLHALADHSKEILAGRSNEILPQLQRAGGSPGGARPKVLIGYNQLTDEIISGESDLPPQFAHWLVKFSSLGDPDDAGSDDAGSVEFAYSKMAQKAGIDIPATSILTTTQGDRFFAVKRFDRGQDNRRRNIHTFGDLIHANFRLPSCDYADLLKATSLLTKNNEDVLRAFRLMVFNMYGHNRDDHVKNFTFILNDDTGQWSLAPAYDLTFSSGPGGEHTTTIHGEGQAPDNGHILNLAEKFDIPRKQAKNIIAEVTEAISQWQNFAKDSGVSSQTCRHIARRITP